jgi:ribosomal protein L30E
MPSLVAMTKLALISLDKLGIKEYMKLNVVYYALLSDNIKVYILFITACHIGTLFE